MGAAALVALALPPVSSAGRLLDERIVSVALLFILFDGGMHIGWRRFRSSAGAISWLGITGTLVTAAAVAVAAHLLFGFGLVPSLLLGAALSPTDPAVVFSVLGKKEFGGRTGTILEGESGANDPVGIAIMASLLAAGGTGWNAIGSGALTFVMQLAIGVAVGVAGGFGLRFLLQRFALPNGALASVLTIAAALFLYGAGAALYGSGFLAVFVAGILVGDIRAPYKAEVVTFSSGIASLSEIVAFTVLGLTVRLEIVLQPAVLITGMVLALVLILIIRPLLVGVISLPLKLPWGERAFILWAGLKGAVPILLGLTVVSSGAAHADQLYAIVFVVVVFSVLLQGGLAVPLARAFGVPMRDVQRRPYAIDIRFAHPPEGFQRLVVAAGSTAAGRTIGELPVGDHAWISLGSRQGRNLPIRPATRLEAGDIVLAHVDPPAEPEFREMFTRRRDKAD
jgi:cell volume regulation protein A